jgi:hypothetical protein
MMFSRPAVQWGIALSLAAAVAAWAQVLPEPTSSPEDQLVVSAMTAAPEAVVKAAAVVVLNADGSMRSLRPGKDGFTCMPNNPAIPGPGPMCMDRNAMEWTHAWMTHTPPPDKVGFMFMLGQGSGASNTAGPRVMVVGPAVKNMRGYPRHAAPDTSGPYVMWAGTPYEHLVIPMR